MIEIEGVVYYPSLVAVGGLDSAPGGVFLEDGYGGAHKGLADLFGGMIGLGPHADYRESDDGVVGLRKGSGAV